MAGERLEDAIDAIRATNAAGMAATLDFLGEHVDSEAEARVNADEYIRALHAIHRAGLDANISIKLTAMGLAVDDAFCYQNVRRIVQAAAEWATSCASTWKTRRSPTAPLPSTSGCATSLAIPDWWQAYLHRTEGDVRRLMQEGRAHLRLCKGAYDEPPAVAWQEKADVDRSLVALMKLMLDGRDAVSGVYPALASHDHMIINWTKAYAYMHGIPADRFEFQMLYGIRRDLQQKLADQGYRMRVYIPYGTRWYPYYMRRLAERPANVVFFARDVWQLTR